MSQQRTKAVVLAAGMGTRMKSTLPKVLHPILGAPMVHYPVRIALAAGCEQVALVVGHGREKVESTIADAFVDAPVTFHLQEQMNGTADAVRSAADAYRHYDGAVLILYGDVPNLPPASVTRLLEMHGEGPSPLSILTAIAPGETDYGRIVRDEQDRPSRIVEARDCDEAQRAIREVNIGVYVVDAPFLLDGLARMDNDNAQGEFYLTDLVEMAAQSGEPAQVLVGDDIEALHGVNTRVQLARAEAYARRRRNEELMLAGITMHDPDAITVGVDVEIGQDVVIEQSVAIRGASRIGANATIEQGCRIEDAAIGSGATIGAGCVLRGVTVSPDERVPPLTVRIG